MKVLVACEESQRVCTEFRKRGHEAYSCDIQRCSGGHPEWHICRGSLKIEDILEQTKGSLIISDAFTKADSVLNHKGYKNIACSVSGGADSDILVDICEKVKPHSVHYVWFDTGIEYQATKEHLKYLEKHYGITVEREREQLSQFRCPISYTDSHFSASMFLK